MTATLHMTLYILITEGKDISKKYHGPLREPVEVYIPGQFNDSELKV